MLYLERLKAEDQARSWQMFMAILPHSKEAARYYDEMQYNDEFTHMQRMFMLYEELPMSVRELITLPTPDQLREMGYEGADVAALTGQTGTGIAWWQAQAEREAEQPRGKWFAAALRAIQPGAQQSQEPTEIEEDTAESGEDSDFVVRGL